MAIVAKVKSVSSGDTLVLKSTKSGAERTLSLAFVSAPRLRREGDESHAFQSRDFLRKIAVGKEVTVVILYTSPAGREYGLVTLPDGTSLVEVLVNEGVVKVRDDAGKHSEQAGHEPLIEMLRIYEEQAKDAQKGTWNQEDDGLIDSTFESPSNPQEFLEEHKGRPIDGIVERVISADRFAVRLILDPKTHQQLVLLLAGVRAPSSTRSDSNGLIIPGEEYGDEAREYVETRLLQRTIKAVLLGVSQQGQLVGSIIHPAGNIAGLLLSQGFARCLDFHSAFLGPAMAELRDAEKYAKDHNLRLYKAHVAKKKDSGSEFDAIVSRIYSPDTLFVRNKAGGERKINLSSVRQPKPKDPVQGVFLPDAKEFLRKRLIGKTVRVRIDGKRPAQDGYEEKEMATVTLGDKNIALALVENGYASVIRHRQGDEDRSPIWDTLLAAEEVAKKEQKGMYSSKVPSKMVEASETIQKAKSYLSFLQRQKKVPAVVDFAASGSRFKVIIPKENARLTFILSGITAPKTARNPSEQSEPFGLEALAYVSKKCLQRDVEVDVEDIDRVGGFIGTMYVNRENVAKGLVEEGFASVHEYSAEKTGHANELFAAESRAKAARKGIWHDWSAEKESAGYKIDAPVAAKQEAFEKRSDYRDVVLSHFDTGGNLKIQVVGAGSAALEEMMGSFRKFHANPANSKTIEGMPKAGQYVAASFTEDDTFYRARIRHVDRTAQEADVTYIDFGNSEKIPWSRIRPLTQAEFSVERLKPQALDAVWSFINFPFENIYAEMAYEFVYGVTAGKQLVASVDHIRLDGTLEVSIYEPESTVAERSLNFELVEQGLAYVPKKLANQWRAAHPKKIAALEEAQVAAERCHTGMWKYGDNTPDEE